MSNMKLDYSGRSSLKQAIVHSIRVHANRLFVTYSNENKKATEEKAQEKYTDWTYAQLGEEVFRILQIIKNASAVGSRVSLMFNHDGLAYAAMFACILSDRTFVPLNLRQPPARLRQIMRTTESTLLLTDNFLNKKACEIFDKHENLKIINIETDVLSQKRSTQNSDGNILEYSYSEAVFPAYVLFTSGSTGEPKGVVVSHNNLFSYLCRMNETFEILPEDRITQQFEASFDSGIGEIFHGFLCGASLHPLRSFEIPFIRSYLQRVKPTVWGGTPSMLNLVKQILKPTDTYPSVRFSFFMGERLTHESASYWTKMFPHTRLFNLYGPTETTINVLFHEWHPGEANSVYGVPLGGPIGSNQISIINDAGLPVQSDEIGEICISGSQVALGYLVHSETENATKFQSLLSDKGQYRSGDYAILKEGIIHFVGRKDDQVKIRGFRLDLNEVEYYVRQSLPQTAAVAFLIPADQPTGVGLLLDKQIDPTGVHALIESLRIHLASYAVPIKIYFVKEWPLTATDKIDRSKINADFLLTSAVLLNL